jgi:eukaryotic-like serine/threonine-protein kinase
MHNYTGQQFGSYRLLDLLGRGGFADVYLAEHTYLRTQVALKLFRARLDDEHMQGFLAQMRAIARLQHPHIVRILECDIHDGAPFLVMHHAPNGTLRQRHPKGSQLPLTTVLAFTRQAASALDYAHRAGQIHGDVKPENMLLGDHNELLLSDFGLSPTASRTFAALQSQVFGTITYMAPEQLQGQPGPACDQYALAIAVYEWLAGEPPFHGTYTEVATQHALAQPPSLREKRSDLSYDVEQVVLRALSKDSQQRFPCVQDFVTALQQAAATPSPSLETALLSEHPRHGMRERPHLSRRALILSLAGGAAVLGAGISWASFSRTAPPQMMRRAQEMSTQSSQLPAPVTPTPSVATQEASYIYRGLHPVTCLAWAPDGSRIASGDDRGNLLVWQWRWGNRVEDILLASHQETYTVIDKNGMRTESNLQTLAWAPDSKHLALGTGDEIHVWDSTTNEDQFNLGDFSGLGHSVAWSPHGTRIAAAGYSQPQLNEVRSDGLFLVLWDARTGTMLGGGSQSGSRQDGRTGPTGIAWSPGGSLLAWGEINQVYITQMNADGSFQQGTLQTLKASAAHNLAWSPDSTHLATTSSSFPLRIQIWDVYTGKLAISYQDPGSDVNSLAWSPNGRALASVHTDGSVRLWDATTGANTATYLGHNGPAMAVSWSPDSTFIASGGDDGTVRIWKV